MSRPTQQGQAGTYQSDQAPLKNDGIPNATTCYHGLVLQAMQKKKNPLAVFGVSATTHIDGDNTEEQSNLYLVTWAEEMPTPSEAEVPWKPHPDICRHLQHAHLAAAPSSAHLAFSSTQTSCFSNLLGQTQAAPRKAKGGTKGEG